MYLLIIKKLIILKKLIFQPSILSETDWYCLQSFSDINLTLEVFYGKLYGILDQYVPEYKTYQRVYPKWFTSEIIKNIKQKNKHLVKYKKSKSNYHLEQFKQLRTLIKRQIELSYQEYLSNIQSSLLSDPKNFWSFIQAKRQQTRIPGKMFYLDKEYDSPQDIVNVFAEFFSSVYTTPNYTQNSHMTTYNNFEIINIENISMTEIQDAAKKLKNKMTAGPDLIYHPFW